MGASRPQSRPTSHPIAEGTSPHSPIRLPAARIGMLMGVAAVIAGLGSSAYFLLTSRDSAVAAAIGTAPVIIAIAIGSAIFVTLRPRPAFNWAFLIMAGSAARLALAVAIGMAVYFRFDPAPDKIAYWTSFLLAALSSLIVEAMVARPALSTASPTTDPRARARSEHDR